MTTVNVDLVPLASSLDAAAQARRAVRAALRDADEDTSVQACLMVDELVASTLMRIGAPIQLVLERHIDRLVVEVVGDGVDDGTSIAAHLGIARAILDAWADEWGVVDHPPRSSVWFRISVP